MLKRVLVFTALVTMLMVNPVIAQQSAPTSEKAEQLVGHWTLVSVKNEQDGKTTEPFGPNPKGLFIFDRSGRYAVLIFRSDLPKFPSNNLDKGTPEENKAVVTGSLAHFGTYSVNEKEGSYSLRPEAGMFPNWVGIDQKRSFSVLNDELKVTNPGAAKGGTSTLILQRAR